MTDARKHPLDVPQAPATETERADCPGAIDLPGIHVDARCDELAAAFDVRLTDDRCPAAESPAEARQRHARDRRRARERRLEAAERLVAAERAGDDAAERLARRGRAVDEDIRAVAARAHAGQPDQADTGQRI